MRWNILEKNIDGEHSRLAESVISRGTDLSCIWVRMHCGWTLREANGFLFPLTLPSDIKMGAEEKRNCRFQGAVCLCPPGTEAQPGTAGAMRLCQALRFKDALKLLPDSVTSQRYCLSRHSSILLSYAF